MDKKEAKLKILEAKAKKGLTWSEIARALQRSEVWTTAALLGQHPLSPSEAETVTALLELEPEVAVSLTKPPFRGEETIMPPRDSVIYRFYEIILVYGPAIKELIHEKFGDGIMSAIDFEMDIQRVEDPKGDRVVVTMNGKFLPYRKW